jgi:hypothetical protein
VEVDQQVALGLSPLLFVHTDHPRARAQGAHSVEQIRFHVLAGSQEEDGIGAHEVLALGREQPELVPPALLLEFPDGLELVVVG